MHVLPLVIIRRRAIRPLWPRVCGRAAMAQRIDDARRWRARAEEVRDLAEQLTNPECKRILLGIAVSFIALAQMAQERDTAKRRD